MKSNVNAKTGKAKKRILIANRGEIAIRIAKAVRELGHTALGLYTDNELNAAHLEYCHEWIKLEGGSNLETYLNIPQLVKVAKGRGADAIHPGYGFLSENEHFASVLEQEGIIFIGPSSHAIEKMGDKAHAKKLARSASVPVVPGSEGEVANLEEAVQIANKIGYPVLLKAVAGGGGKGMRLCQNAEEVRALFEMVRREATAAFGYGEVLLEKFIVNPHHIEVQILADKKGNVFHLFERECSIQRRHQKIVEEAPSPFIGSDEELRSELCRTAVQLAKAVGYDSAGTVEFIMGQDRKFYFLEMNTRIQVEHPITEEITGIDLVAAMIKGAFGEDLGIENQQQIKKFGNAIECRICSEDPFDMLPSPGTVTAFDTLFPQGIRFDHCIYSGLNVTPEFDPMVGKLVAKSMNREMAINKMKVALEGLFIEGLKTNIPLHRLIMENAVFLGGVYSTNFLYEENLAEKGILLAEQVATQLNYFTERIALAETLKLMEK